MELSTGGVQRGLFGFVDARPHQRPAVLADKLCDGVRDGLASKFIVVVTAPDELTTKGPEVVAMPAYGRLGQTQVQQMEQERREHLNDLLAYDDVAGLDVP